MPTDDNFDPILFLTLVHRTASYDTLNKSMIQLSNKTDNQVQQLQNLVRDNFALFVRCADGIDVFNERGGDGINERIDSLEGLALVAEEQSRKSSKCARELADLVMVLVGEAANQANGLKPTEKDSIFDYAFSPLDECKQLAEEAVVTVERRRCIFAFDVCARTCSSRASGSGRFDAGDLDMMRGTHLAIGAPQHRDGSDKLNRFS